MLQHNDSRNPRDQESTERSMPSIPQKAEDCRDAEADQDGDPLDVSILPANELVFLQVGYVVVRLIGLQLEKQPTDMREKKNLSKYSTDHRHDPHAYDDAGVRSPTSKPNFQ